MVFTNKITIEILNKFPSFASSKAWKEHCEFWGDDEAGICNIFSSFGRYVLGIINGEEQPADLKEIFDFIEPLMLHEEQDVQDAAATCFLENLINYDSWGRLSAKSFIPYLGKESIAYCKAWDEFTGVKTEGLWD